MTTKPKTVPELRFPGFEGEWENKKIDSIAQTITSGSRDWAEYYAPTGSKFIRMTNLPRGGIQLLLNDLRFVNLPEDSSEGKRTSLEADDILISITAELGKIGWVPPGFGTAYINQHTALLRLDLNRANAPFVAHLLASERKNNEINSLNDAGAKAGLNLPTIRSFPLHLPTLPEQRKIADFLTAVDGWIGQLSQKKALLEDYKKGVMQQLFTQALRFKDDHGNDFPEWEEKTLGEISRNVMYGMNAAATAFDGETKYIRITDIDESSNRFRPNPVTSPDEPAEDRYKLRRGDIVFARTGASVGKSYLYDEADGNLAFAGFLIRFSICEEVAYPYFIFLQTLSENYWRWVKVNSMRSGQPGINAEEYKTFPFQLPSLPEQTKIANFLTALDRKIESVSSQITHTQTFKKGLLQQMFV